MSHRDLVAAPPPGFHVLATTVHLPCRGHVRAGPPVSTACSSIPRWCTRRPAGRSCRISSSTSAAALSDWNPAGQIAALSKPRFANPPAAATSSSSSAEASIPPSPITLCLRQPGPGPRPRRVRRYRPDARRRNRFRARATSPRSAPAVFKSSTPSRSSSPPLGTRHRAGTKAPHHRRGVRPSAGAHSRNSSASSTAAGFSDRAPSIPTPSNPAARAKADLIKTHHNRVAGIQKLIDEGRIDRAAQLLL